MHNQCTAAVGDVKRVAELTDADKQVVHNLATADSATARRRKAAPFQPLPMISAGSLHAIVYIIYIYYMQVICPLCWCQRHLLRPQGKLCLEGDAHICEAVAGDDTAYSRVEGGGSGGFAGVPRFVCSKELRFDESDVRCKAKGGKKQRKRERHNRRVVVQIGTPGEMR